MLPRATRREVAALLCAAVLAACGGSGKPSAEPASNAPLTQRDLRWLKAYDDWAGPFGAAVVRVHAFAEERDVETYYLPALHPLKACDQSLYARVPTPPERFERAFALTLQACDEYLRMAEALEKAYTTSPDPGASFDTASSHGAAGGRLLADVQQDLGSGLAANRRLPRAKGPPSRSRIEPALSAAASEFAEVSVEIRCWSARDWRSLRRELVALGLGHADGFALPAFGRANLSPAICRPLTAFVRGHRIPAEDEERLDLAAALVAATHETVHLVDPAADEATVECVALQRASSFAEQLGARPSEGRLLATLYWDELWAFARPEYRSPQCRSGGKLDLDPLQARWP